MKIQSCLFGDLLLYPVLYLGAFSRLLCRELAYRPLFFSFLRAASCLSADKPSFN